MAKKEMTLFEKLSAIQVEFKANKSRYNSFGKYNFRSAEDILEALKPINEKYSVFFTVEEELLHHDPPIIKSISRIFDIDGLTSIEAVAIVGVDLAQKGMQVPQQYGSASSYAKKYSLGNLLLIDDTQDADASNKHGKESQPAKPKVKIEPNSDTFKKAVEFIKGGGDLKVILSKYDVSAEAEAQLRKIGNE